MESSSQSGVIGPHGGVLCPLIPTFVSFLIDG